VDEPTTSTLTPIVVELGGATRAPDATPRSWGAQLWRRYVVEVRDDANARAEAARAATRPGLLDARAAVVLVTVAVCLTFTEFATRGIRGSELHQLGVWALVQSAGYLVLPLVVTRFVLRSSLGDIGLGIRNVASHVREYAVLYAVAAPFVVAVSFSAAFQDKYPFYDLAPGEGLSHRIWIWWVLYAVQFFALETFFRGFLLHGLVPRLGYASLFVMVVPYNMIHYGKPWPEAIAAIVGALALGSLSLRNRSIWWGAALHCTIAGTMDAFALWHAGVIL